MTVLSSCHVHVLELEPRRRQGGTVAVPFAIALSGQYERVRSAASVFAST